MLSNDRSIVNSQREYIADKRKQRMRWDSTNEKPAYASFFAAFFFGFLGTCGLGGVASIRRSTSSSFGGRGFVGVMS
jgi:hypothetical protein